MNVMTKHAEMKALYQQAQEAKSEIETQITNGAQAYIKMARKAYEEVYGDPKNSYMGYDVRWMYSRKMRLGYIDAYRLQDDGSIELVEYGRCGGSDEVIGTLEVDERWFSEEGLQALYEEQKAKFQAKKDQEAADQKKSKAAELQRLQAQIEKLQKEAS